MKRIVYLSGLFICNACVATGAALIALASWDWKSQAACGFALIVFGITGWIVCNTSWPNDKSNKL